MKKVLFKIKSLGVGGVARLTVDILNNLKLDEREIILLLENKEENFLEEQLNKNIKKIYLKPDWFNPFLDKIKLNKKNFFYKIIYNFMLIYERILLAKKINKIIKRDKEIDIFIDYSGTATRYIQKIVNVKKIIWIHSSLVTKSEKKKKKMIERLKKYDKIITICNEMKNELIELEPEMQKKIVCIYNFVDLDKIKKRVKDTKELLIEEKKMLQENYCISIGRMEKLKDFETTIKAFSLLRKKGIKEKLYILGDGSEFEILKKIIKDENLEEQVLLLGTKLNPYIWLKNADLFIHSSKLEGFSMVILEAIACEKVIISSLHKTGAKEIIDLGVGEGFEIGDYEKLAEIIELLLQNKELREKYEKKCSEVIKLFTKEKILQEYREVIEK